MITPTTYAIPGLMVPIEIIQQTVAEYFGLTADDLKLRTNRRAIVWPRQIAITFEYMYYMNRYLNGGFEDIGTHYNLDRTTAIYAKKTVFNIAETTPSVYQVMAALAEKITKKTHVDFDITQYIKPVK